MSMDIPFLLEALRVFVSLVILGILGIQDLKTREISSTLVYSYLGTSIIFFVVSTAYSLLPDFLKLFYSAISLLATGGVFFLLYRYKLVGDGDFFVALALGFLYSYPDVYIVTFSGKGILPPSLVILLYSSIASMLLMIGNGLLTLKHASELRKIPGIYKILVPLFARPVKLKEYLAGRYRHVYPVQVFRVEKDGKLRVDYRLVVNIEENVESRIRELYANGYLGEESYLWVTPGLPFIFFFFLGLATFILLGDNPILHLLASLIPSPQ